MPENAKDKHKKVEAYLREEKRKYQQRLTEPSSILLGSADSGKSTLLRQLKLINGIGFTDDELLNAKTRIEKNLFNALVVGMTDLKKYRNFRPLVEDAISNVDFTPELKHNIIKVCTDENVRKQIQDDKVLPENTMYFVDSVARIFDAEYVPSTQDILNMRDPTKSVTETIIPYKGNCMHVFDVSGLRQDRTKWLPFFDDVSSVMFVTSLSSFDRNLIEDPTVNQMRDALELYKNLCNHELLKKKHFTLILNKLDLFKKKLETSHIIDYFKSYDG